jgi:hypothetical protein
MQQTTPQKSLALTTGALQLFPSTHAPLDPHRQTGVAALVSHHSPAPQQAVPQQGPVEQAQEGSGAHWCPPWPPALPPEPTEPPVAPPPCPPVVPPSLLFVTVPQP